MYDQAVSSSTAEAVPLPQQGRLAANIAMADEHYFDHNFTSTGWSTVMELGVTMLS